MNQKEAKKRIEKLKEVIKHHRYLYHVLDKQEISEDALDSLKHELFELEEEYPQFRTPDSPTQRVGGEPLDKFEKIEHETPMLSIEDVFSFEELKKWEDYLKRLTDGDFNYFSELKIDGFAVSLVYKDGFLEESSTRGNGKVGENVTENIKTLETIPLKLKIHSDKDISQEVKKEIELKINEGRIEVRGEVYIEKEDFKELNKKLEKKEEKTFSNPRNLAAGTIRQLDPKEVSNRPLKFLAYEIITNLGQTKHSQEHIILTSLGFNSDKGKECQNLKEVLKYWEGVQEKRNGYPFQIDGVVVNVNDNRIAKALGVAGKSPRGVRAFKFPPSEATTIVQDIQLQVGRTGAITPVADLKPVKIEGVTVSRATLHNFDEIERLGLKKGDTVSVARAGDVIPIVTKVFTKLRTGDEEEIKIPKKCPSCGTKLVKSEDVVWRCPNPDCFDRKKRLIHHFISKGAFDIVGLGPQNINKFLEEGLISSPVDLFQLEKGDILPLEGFSEKATNNLLSSIKESKEINLSRFIYSLGIRNVGEQTARDLAREFNSLENLKKADRERLEKIDDVGPVVADSIIGFFNNRKNLELIEGLKKEGVKIKNPKQKSKFKDLKFVLTGQLEKFSRREAKEKIIQQGGKVSSSVSQNTDYLVVGENPGSKLDKARKEGVKIIREEEFIRML